MIPDWVKRITDPEQRPTLTEEQLLEGAQRLLAAVNKISYQTTAKELHDEDLGVHSLIVQDPPDQWTVTIYGAEGWSPALMHQRHDTLAAAERAGYVWLAEYCPEHRVSPCGCDQ